MKKLLSYAMNKGEIPMKKAIAFLTCCAVFPLCSGTVANSAESDNAENKIKVTFNDYMNMEDEEFSEFFNLSEYYFGDDSVDDAVKFEKYLNTPPSYYNGDNWISEKYCAYKQFISGEAEPYVCFSTDEYIETVDFTPMDLGYPADWEIEGYNGKWVVELADGTIYSKDINQYRLHVPVEVIADFETYVRLDVSKSYFNEIEKCLEKKYVSFYDGNREETLYKYYFSPEGKIIKKKWWYSNKYDTYSSDFSYNDKLQITQINDYNIVRNKKGLIDSIWIDNWERRETYKYEYHDFSKAYIRSLCDTDFSEYTKVETEYDEYHNWIKKICYIDNEVAVYYERKIVYK